jgi:mandelate racemase
MNLPPLTVRAIRAVAVEVPMRHVLGTSQAVVRAAPLLLIDVETEEGITGHAYLFCYLPAAAAAIASFVGEIERLVKGQPIAPEPTWNRLARRFTLIGVQGTVRMAMSGFDVACWDALAIAAKQPLAGFIGATPRAIRAYNSNGLGLMPPPALAREAHELLEGGFTAIKLRLGYPTLAEDLAAVRAVRGSVGEDVAIMVDYNQALGEDEALARGRALDGERVAWLEEPLRHDDYRACARLAAALETPVQIGENFSTPAAMEEALAAKACDLVMPDLERIGGVTGWLRAAQIAEAAGKKMSSHLFPEVSAHLLAATPTADWLEYVDWAAAILEEPMRIEGGFAHPTDRPGNGLSWDAAAVRRYRIQTHRMPP